MLHFTIPRLGLALSFFLTILTATDGGFHGLFRVKDGLSRPLRPLLVNHRFRRPLLHENGDPDLAADRDRYAQDAILNPKGDLGMPIHYQNAPLPCATCGEHDEETYADAQIYENEAVHFTQPTVSIKASTIMAVSNSSSSSSSSTCKETYGFMPCSNSIIGNIFLLAAYGYIMFRAAKLLADGSELLLVVVGTGIVGGLLLPLLGVLPDAILVLVSGLGGSKVEAQEQVLVGVGLLAGSNIMLLTILWGACLIIGRCDFFTSPSTDKKKMKEKELTRKCDLVGTGVETDDITRTSAGIMCTSIIPLIVVQVPYWFFKSSRIVATNIPVLIAFSMTMVGLFAYIIYQVLAPGLHRRRRYRTLYMLLFLNVKQERRIEGKLVDKEVLKRIFNVLDTNKDNKLTKDEVRVMLIVGWVNENLHEKVLNEFMKEFDVDESGDISWEEFLASINECCLRIMSYPQERSQNKVKRKLEELGELLLLEEMEDNEPKNMDNIKDTTTPTTHQIARRAISFLALGVTLAAFFAEPLVDTINQFSKTTHIPSFFASFVLLPLASNSSEAISSILFSRRKRKVNISLTYSQIYGAVTMNNTMSLGIFLAIVYMRHLVWEFSSEVLIICLVTLVMGIVGYTQNVLALWLAGLALLLYPLSIALVAILEYVAHWE